MYKPRRFIKEELFPPEIIKQRGELVWELMDDRLLITLDALSDFFGPMWVNNWYIGGKIYYGGWRPREYQGCAGLSQHYYGRAADPKPVCSTMSGYEKYVNANPKRFKDIVKLKQIIRWAKGKNISATVTMIREWILAHPEEYPHINAVETGISWLHIDNRNCKRIMQFPG